MKTMKPNIDLGKYVITGTKHDLILSERGIIKEGENAGLKSDIPLGAIENGRAFADRLENYQFECEGGNLNMCSDWQEFRRCFEYLSEWVMHSQTEHPATDAFLAEVRAQGVEMFSEKFGGGTPPSNMVKEVAADFCGEASQRRQTVSKIDYQALREAAEAIKVVATPQKLLAFRMKVTPQVVLALLDERERNQQYIKRRDQENEDIALTVGKLRVELEGKDSKIANLTAERDALREGEMGDARHSNTRAAADIYFQLVEECEIPAGGSLVEYVDDMREKLEAAEKRNAKLQSENAYIRNRYKELDLLIGKNILVMQAAIIEWQSTGDAKSGLAWIYNTLFGPGELPDESEKDAQAYFNRKYAPIDEKLMELHKWFWEQSEAERAAGIRIKGE